MIFTLALSSLDKVNLLIHYNNQLAAVKLHLTNIAAVQNMGYHNKCVPLKTMETY